MSDEEFFAFCQLNRELRIEREQDGRLIIMTPTGGETGSRNFDLIVQFGIWVCQDGTGKGFDSSTGFILPNGANRSPDVAWVKLERWESLTKEQRKKFVPLCPDFVIELRSGSDRLQNLQDKMAEYRSNGTLLGWLIDPDQRQVYVYRLGAEVEQLDNPATVSGEPVLPGFVLQMDQIWD
ncbi:MAG: Uma2 family endonuclease [Moorea sp. SIO1G6]|nr:Uma2 family endonuclease [Moorena sp. SIO3B2]NEP68667.1 Uma2 family endonuclease [Moorena sp. SIO3A5]NEQ13142.1 Uma2 family endonuclease [Moorena sp. SIO3E2]NER90443.1 Uma2 family endonuclease [Moorena sp. SIO3A2]NES42754.1 Uma2 family endonuclease [Moorena sp. SIO2C4]NES83416.1 Uma2 family endonuclease [Moorena sp. SIO2B7]NET68939.1 Uma2 family endonuclease [Moorena sp. SIO1G6]